MLDDHNQLPYHHDRGIDTTYRQQHLYLALRFHSSYSIMMNSRISLDEEIEEPLREKETELANKPLEFLLDCLGLRYACL